MAQKLVRKKSAGKSARKTGRPRSMKTVPRAMAAPTSQHHRVTVHRAHPDAAMGMQARSRLTHAGATAHFDVWYLSSMRHKGAMLAQAILANCERDYTTLAQIFGGLAPGRLPFVVHVTAGATGASHSSCLGTDIQIGGKSGTNVDFIRSLLVAEADEVFMANFGHGWDCGASNGEGLSRVLANDIYQGVEPGGFISSNSWLDSTRQDFIDETYPSDTDYPSIGCSVLFLNWLRFQLNHPWANIVAAGAGTLAGTYQNLTGRATAWQDFSAVIEAHWPPGRTYNLKTDNPFPV